MKKIRLTRKLFTVHSWLGLIVGIFYFLISVSGASVVFVNELTELVYRSSMRLDPQSQKTKLSYDSLFEIAKKEHSGVAYIVVGYDSRYPENAPFVSGVKPRPHDFFTPNLRYNVSYVDPSTKEIFFRTSSSGKGDFFHWLVDFHDSFVLGAGGELFVALVSVMMLTSIITGLILYRKYLLQTLLFRAKADFRNWRRTSTTLHRVIGTWALLINIFIFFSGVYMYKDYFLSAWWKEYTNRQTVLEQQTKNFPPATTSLDSIAVKAKQVQPDMILESIAISLDSTRTISVMGPTSDKLFLWSDNYAIVDFNFDGSLKQNETKKWSEMSFREQFDNLNFNLLHTGWALGMLGKILWTLIGFTPAVLSVTGFLLWWRQKSRLKRRDRYIALVR
jgi:uncharacterized iron-regulated membrane protein